MKDKYDFILQLLDQSKLTPTQKQRVLILSSNEIKKDKLGGKELEERVKRIEEKINLKPSEINLLFKENEKELNKATVITYKHYPKTTVELLNRFTEDTNLKYTTHIWDKEIETGEEVINRETFAEDIHREFYNIYSFKTLENIGVKPLYNTIWNFVVGPNKFGWGRYKLSFGWHNKELIDYYLLSDENSPLSFIVPDKYLPDKKIKGKTLKYFEDFVNIFKSEIEFRGNELYNLLNRKFDFGFEYKIEIAETLKGKSIYTYTAGIEYALDLIANNIKQRSKKDKHIQITSEYNAKGKYIVISITDLGSYSNSRLDNPKLTFQENKGQMKLIRDNLISLCDFSIVSKFEENGELIPLELDYLNKDRPEFKDVENQFIIKKISEAFGFTYKIKFYV